ncbi:MAG: hypothetical protein KUG68_10940 [Flavobacteriaceae bacterium]|nr:hypothetical protein [Flavobacteriaceae bacterium]
MKHILVIFLICILFSCKPKVVREYIMEPCPEEEKKSMAIVKQELLDGGFEIFDYVDEETGDTIIMQKYFMVFLNRGSNRDQNKAETDSLQALHMDHLTRMYEEGYADISGPFGDDGDMRGITIYNVPNLKFADSLAHLDPMVKAGRLELEIKPWWAGKGYPLR